MQDRPNVAELIAAVRHFLEHEVLPAQGDQRLKFRTRVAANALTIAERELLAGTELVETEVERLRELVRPLATFEGDRVQEGQMLRLELARKIRAGAADNGPWREAVLASTVASVRAKLMISNPKLVERDERRWGVSASSQLS